jgi:transposase
MSERPELSAALKLGIFEQTADLLSVIQTCRFQGKSAMAFFRDALSAHSCNFFIPSLVP